MKNKINLIERLWNDSHEKQKVRGMRRYAAMLIMLLTLGVGQMWAGQNINAAYLKASFNGSAVLWDGSSDEYVYSGSGHSNYDLGTLTGDFIITYVSWRAWTDWYNTTDFYLYYNTDGNGSSFPGSIKQNWSGGSGDYYPKTTSLSKTVASVTDGSGEYDFEHYFYADFGGYGGGNRSWLSNGGSNYHFTYTILPPDVSSFSVTESNHLSGSGTSADPYIMPYNGTLSLSISGSKGHTDANSSAQYYNTSSTDAWSATATKSIGSITSTTKTSVTIKMRYYNSSAKLAGTESTKTIYYQSEPSYSVTASTGGHGSVTPTSATAMGTTTGGNITATEDTGYDFASWAITSGSGYFGTTGTATTSTTANTKFRPSANSTVTATFTPKTTTVTLDGNAPAGSTVTGGGTEVTATYDAALPSFSALTCNNDYALKGYYIATSGGDPIITAGGTFNANSGIWNRTDGSTLTLYAQWSLDRTLTYDGNGNTSGNVPAAATTYANGTSVTVLGNTAASPLVKTGYTFTGWNTADDGNGTGYSASDKITMNANYTLYAQWDEDDHTVTVTAGSNGSVASGSVTGHYDTKVTLPAATANTGYHFNTWTTTSGSVTYTNQTSASTAQVNGLTAAATVRADFAANTYSVVFNKNGGSGTMSNQSFTYNEAAKALTSNSFTRSGYTFLGWATTAEKANALTVDYTNGQSVQNLTSTNGGTFNLYAVWAKKYYIGGRFQHDWEDGSTTTNEMTYDASTGYYKFTTSKTVSELSAQWHNVSGNYDDDQVFFIHTGTGKVGSSSNPFYTTPNQDGAGRNFETSNSYSNALVLANQETTWGEIVKDRCVQFSNVDNLSSSVIIWWDPANKKVWYTATESLNTNYYLLGFADSDAAWTEADARRFKVASVNATTATVSVSLTAKTYTKNTRDGFKVENGGAWYGNDGTMTRANCSNWTFSTGTVNCGITADLAGTYTFTLNLSTKAVSVTYPTAYQLNYSIGTVPGTSGSISTSPSTATGSYVGSGNSVTLTGPAAKTGYTWSGWFTNAAGTEGQIADDSRAITVTMNADKTLYACYTENAYATTVSAGSNGSVSPSGSVNIKQITGTSLTATPNTGYRFVDWTISGGGITPGTSSTSPQTFKATETGGTIQANFAENMHTVTVASNNTAFGTVNESSVSAGISTASGTITATPATGATFTGWTLPGSGVTIVAPATTSSTSITINATADSKSITANFSETKHTVTLTNQNSTYGDVNTSSPQNVGQITAVQIRATPKSGYMFAGWVKTTGSGTVTYHTAAGTGQAVDATGNTQATTYITVDGDVTLQATWDEDRSSGWFMRGVWDDGWTEDGEKPFIKNVGETSGTVSHVRWTLDPRNFTNAILEMKVYDGSKYWAHWSTLDAPENLCTKASNNSNIGFYQDDKNQNFRISIEVYGEYDFEWDSSTKYLTVHYPQGNFIRGGFNSWGWEDDLTATGNDNEFAGTIHLDANQTLAANSEDGFKVVILGDHYGKDGTTITRASNTANSLSKSGQNIGLTTDVEGDYTFTINTSSKNLSVTYPTAYTVTFGYGVGGSAVSASATSRDGSFASGGYVASGDDITFSQTPAAGYTFKGWYTTADGDTEVSTMGESDNVLNGLSGNATVYAQYIPTTYTNVTLNATTGSTNGAYSVTFGGTSITVTTDPVKTGYEPEGFYESYSDGVWTNKIADSDGTLQSNTTYTDATGHWKATNSPTLYTKWQPKTYAITLDDNGSYVSDGSATATYDSNTLTDITAPQRTGYSVEGYYKEAGCTNLIATPAGALEANKDGYTGAGGIWQKDAIATLYTKWTANSYDVTLDANSGEGAGVTISATYDSAMPGSDKTSTALVAPTKTGYDFDGYYDAADGGTQYYTSALASARAWDKDANNTTLYAHWIAKSYTVTLSQSTEAGYGSAGANSSVTATYDAPMPTMGSAPVGATGYKFQGYFTEANGGGTQYYDADGSSLRNWDIASATTLHAYFLKSVITDLEHSTGIPKGESVTLDVNPVINVEPEGYAAICWSLLYADTDNPVEGSHWSVAAHAEEGKPNQVRYTLTDLENGSYKIKALYKSNGSSFDACAAGTEQNTYYSTFYIIGSNTITIRYTDDKSYNPYFLRENSSVEIEPMDSVGIKAPEITGYTFWKWTWSEGIESVCDDEEVCQWNKDSICISASFDGTITAMYKKKRVIYFNNTLNWENVYVYFYSGGYWNNTTGSGAKTGGSYTGKHGQMTPIAEGSKIYYFDAEAANVDASYTTVAFSELDQDGHEHFEKTGGVNNKVSYQTDYKSTILPMFVPLAGVEPVSLNSNTADYYNEGYWMNYPENTGYELRIYNKKAKKDDSDSAPYELSYKRQAFAFTGDKTMPMAVNVDLEAGKTYGFKIYRTDDTYYGNANTMTNGHSGDEGQDVWEFKSNVSSNAGLTTTGAGYYTFTLSYGQDKDENFNYLVGVRYPESSGDFRVLYNDTEVGHWRPSAIIPKVTDTTIVSYFVRKNSTPQIKAQKCSLDEDPLHPGSAEHMILSWADLNEGANIISMDTINKYGDGVYNFYFTKDEGRENLVLSKVMPYTGNFYIRVDGAGYSNWDKYISDDHLMPYSDYSFNQTTDPYSHYFTKWYEVKTESEKKNIKFVVANEYSPYISDTIIQDGIANAYVDGNGDLCRSANIRFMYNYKTNEATRRYVDGAQETGSTFLVLIPSNNTSIYDAETEGNAYTQVTFSDDGNWIYEANVWAVPGTQYKLRSKFGEPETSAFDKNGEILQYFKGAASAPNEYELLIGGEGSAREHIRLLYDFKTNRVVSAWLPSGTISSNNAINADVMFIREGQEDVTQVTFGESGAISKIQNVYSVMRFNKWTLNNCDKSTHRWLGAPKSPYERALYWISFPYDVRLSDVFGFGTYGTHWIIEYYDGAYRAAHGYWMDSDANWKFVMPEERNNFVLKAGIGYILALDLDKLWCSGEGEGEQDDIWKNIQTGEIIFPGDIASIGNTSVHYDIPAHNCNITRNDRNIKDSHWNVIGVPTYLNTNDVTYVDATEKQSWMSDGKPKYIYSWNPQDNSITSISAEGLTYRSMHAYMVQYYGDITFTTSTVSTTAAPRRYEDAPQDVEFRLALINGEQEADNTFVRMSIDEDVTAGFEFGQDMTKEMNAGRANIYTLIAGNESNIEVAGNVLPFSNQTTVVPVGVKIKTTGDYTFAIPEGTRGIGVTLIDNVTGIRTSLSALDYTVSLSAGTYDDRFTLEISPIAQTPTDVEAVTGDGVQVTGARKVMIDGLLYIVKDGKVYDAHGARVQ